MTISTITTGFGSFLSLNPLFLLSYLDTMQSLYYMGYLKKKKKKKKKNFFCLNYLLINLIFIFFKS
jgi:hypothetical protein